MGGEEGFGGVPDQFFSCRSSYTTADLRVLNPSA